VEKAAADLRQKRTVQSEQAEQTWDALNTYAHDIVAKAEKGRIDPVIGRDEVYF
jgi:ATP-dependent Clp protease ATP-binding subunit ClpB